MTFSNLWFFWHQTTLTAFSAVLIIFESDLKFADIFDLAPFSAYGGDYFGKIETIFYNQQVGNRRPKYTIHMLELKYWYASGYICG